MKPRVVAFSNFWGYDSEASHRSFILQLWLRPPEPVGDVGLALPHRRGQGVWALQREKRYPLFVQGSGKGGDQVGRNNSSQDQGHLDHPTDDSSVGTGLKQTVDEGFTPDPNIRPGVDVNHSILEQNPGVGSVAWHSPPGPPSQIEIKLIQILSDIRVLKISQDEANQKINDQLEQIISHLHKGFRMLNKASRTLRIRRPVKSQ
ncbi:hypothetical protein NDU88_001205 [Pleurodeles waltl]|uniref:Uncharacterized protein n=1 Tax=Pleurodeles waltl TaxID=8319 RepID=A0AAV7SYL5_PLEWA|nr:hypothetical protein NDU88_001205 [Pleurodeles waltl]